MNEIRKIVTRLLLAVVISLVFGSATRLFDPSVFHTSSAQSDNPENGPSTDGSTASNDTGNAPTTGSFQVDQSNIESLINRAHHDDGGGGRNDDRDRCDPRSRDCNVR